MTEDKLNKPGVPVNNLPEDGREGLNGFAEYLQRQEQNRGE